MMESEKNKNNRRWWWKLLGALALVTLIGLAAAIFHEVHEQEERAETCLYSDSLSCWKGNACLASYKKLVCAASEEGGAAPPDINSTYQCANPKYICETSPLPDGTCCNDRDFCYRDDPYKVCQNGQCTSADDTLCRGFCEVDSDCTQSETPFPFYPDAYSSTFCTGSACFAYVYAYNPVMSPMDLLDLSTLANRNISACLESACFIFTQQTDCSLYSTQICQYAWTCSRYNGVIYRKRSISASIRNAGVGQLVMENGTVVDVPILHNFTLPGGGRYSRAQYNQANAALNLKLAEFMRRIR